MIGSDTRATPEGKVYKMTAKERVKMALDSAAQDAGGDQNETLVFRFRLDKKFVQELGQGQGKVQQPVA